MIVCAKEVKALQIISAGVPWKCHDTHPKSEAESNTFMLLTVGQAWLSAKCIQENSRVWMHYRQQRQISGEVDTVLS